MDSDPVLPATWPPAYPRHRPISGAQAAELDRLAASEHRIPSLVLMEHASRSVAEIAARMADGPGSVLVCCGPGNNGGDGYGCARFLRSWGETVDVVRLSPALPGSEDAALEASLAGRIEDGWGDPKLLERMLERHPALIVDALFGVNLTRELADPYLAWVRLLNASAAPVLSIDVPSGMHTDTGHGMPECVQASVTATMVAPKLGFAPGAAGADAAGHVVEVDIGLPLALHAPLLSEAGF